MVFVSPGWGPRHGAAGAPSLPRQEPNLAAEKRGSTESEEKRAHGSWRQLEPHRVPQKKGILRH